ncbi:hypothetical protein K4F52_000159 [Lecanicillium sp. MT-2017a]|nr:hypothetical protein K4F52_000159 [Lecanicillium sp. MT-2017a]
MDAASQDRHYQLVASSDNMQDESSASIVHTNKPPAKQLASVQKLSVHSATSSAPIASRCSGAAASERSDSDSLPCLMANTGVKQYQAAWDLYCRASEEDKAAVRSELLVYLSDSESYADAGRASSIFRQIPSEQWDDSILAAGVRVLLQAGNSDTAIARFRTGLQSANLTGGVEHILSHTFCSQQWQVFLNIWFEYCAVQKRTKQAALEPPRLPDLAAAPHVANLFFAFDRYVSEQGMAALKFDNFKTFSKGTLHFLRKTLAEIALSKPCQPTEAAAILSTFNSPPLYELYLTTILQKIEQGLEPRPHLVATLSLYQKYREMAGAVFSPRLLHGMFDLYHSINSSGLEEVYRDWHRAAAGGLDQNAYEKFLAYYATVGDVTAVRDLWSRYVVHFPSVLTEPKAFYKTLTAYAQAANITGAEKELQTMEEQGMKPDLGCLNLLLSCYVRANNDGKAAQCFDTICTEYTPDATTLGHIMALSARKGDLESTIAFFNKARVAGIQPSADMVLGLVTAYVRNDQILEAEHICTEFAERGATSTDVWNQLLHYNSLQGRLNKCYQLLQDMGHLGVEWNHDTYEHLLHALVRVNQIQPAYKLLRNACKENMFPISPEHFAIVMDGAVRAGQFELTEVIYPLLKESGLPTTFNVQLALFESAYKRAPTANRTRSLGRGLADHLRSMLQKDPDSAVVNSTSLSRAGNGDIMHLKKQTRRVSHAIKLLIRMREYSTAEELVTLYAKVIPTLSDSDPLPPNIVASLMEAYAEVEDYDRIVLLWDVTWESTYKRSRRHDRPGVYAAFEYHLTQPIAQVARVYRIREDGPGLLAIVQRARDAGFKFTRSTWNLLIRYLAELDQWQPAMDWCETMLMPRWQGWAPVRRRTNLQERRELSNARVLLATKPTVLSLQREWLRLRKLAAWSAVVSARLRDIEQRYPKLHFAFTTMDFEALPETWAAQQSSGGGGGSVREIPTSLKKGGRHILEPMNLAELKAMRKTLVNLLRGERRRARAAYVRRVARKAVEVRMRSGRRASAM